MRIESLESRRHLTATINEGVVLVVGTPGPDAINISVTPERKLTVYEGLVGPTATPVRLTLFPLADVNAIRVNAADGNDVVRIRAAKPLPSPTASTMLTLVGIPTTVHGGLGNDRVEGNLGRDAIFGDAGRDYLVGGPGVDSIFGGDGDDFIAAADGERDFVDGGDNDPTTPAALPPGDSAVVDGRDVVTNVENIRLVGPAPSTVTTSEPASADDQLADVLTQI